MADQDEHRLTDGVSAGTIRAFLDELKRECPETHADMTTEDACKQLVVPRTKEPNCAYVDLLRRSSPKSVSQATVFVSHAWQYKITDVLNTLLEFAEEQDEKDGNPVFFWFDLFMNNQNANITANLPQDWWSTTFKQSIANIGRVLLVLMPWHDPVPLTRAWCLWEIFCGISDEGPEVDIRLPKREEQALEEAIRDSNLGIAYKSKGEYDKAIQYYEKARKIYVETLGEKHPSTAMTLENIGLLHEVRGDKERACEYIQRAADVFEEALGPDHPNTLKAKRSLQRLLGTGNQLQARDEQAEHGHTSEQAGSARTMTSLPSSKTVAQHDEAPPPPPSGWLQKRKRKGRSFLPRWFTLTDNELVYSKSSTGRVRRRIPLSTAQSVELNQDSKELHVCAPGRTFVLRLDARSDASLKVWCSALSSCISSSDE